jgi:hypothetical protein
VIDHRVGRGAEQAFRQRLGLTEQRPWPESERHLGVRSIPHCVDRKHIEYRELGYPFRMIEPGSVRHAAASVGPATAKLLNPSLSITVTMSCAIARFEYGAWSAVDRGQLLAP